MRESSGPPASRRRSLRSHRHGTARPPAAVRRRARRRNRGSPGGPSARGAGRRPGSAGRSSPGRHGGGGARGGPRASGHPARAALQRPRGTARHRPRPRHRAARRPRPRARADPERPQARRLGDHRQQGPDRNVRAGAARGGRGGRRRPVLRGGRGRCHPAAAAPSRVAGRGPDQPRARHRQRHHQLHPLRDGRDRRLVRRRAGRGAAPRVRRGRSDRGRGRSGRRGQGRDPCLDRLPHPRHPGGRRRRGHHRDHRSRCRGRP